MKRKLLAGCLVVVLVPSIGLGVLGYLLFHRVEGNYFDSNGVRIHYTDEGEGTPVILIHGLAANADLNWRRAGVVGELEDDFRVITYDCRGHGLSDQPDDPSAYGLEMIEDVTRLMDHLGIEKAHAAGYSMGGFVLLKFMTLHPERLHCAALCASGWKDPDDPSDIPSPYRKPRKKALPSPPQAASVIPMGAFPQTWQVFKGIRSWVGDRINNKTALKALKKGFLEWVVTQEELEKNEVPAICFIGTNDGLLPMAEDLHEHMANLEYVVLDGANHLFTPTNREFKKKLHEFLLQHQPEK